MAKPKLRAAYDEHDENSAANGLDCSKGLEGQKILKAQQNFKDECDINVIVKRHGIGEIPIQNMRPTLTGDFTECKDFQDYMDVLVDADTKFKAMPADVRERFGNNPAAFVRFCDNVENIEEMRKLGLAHPKDPEPTPPEPMLVRIAPEPPKA